MTSDSSLGPGWTERKCLSVCAGGRPRDACGSASAAKGRMGRRARARAGRRTHELSPELTLSTNLTRTASLLSPSALPAASLGSLANETTSTATLFFLSFLPSLASALSSCAAERGEPTRMMRRWRCVLFCRCLSASYGGGGVRKGGQQGARMVCPPARALGRDAPARSGCPCRGPTRRRSTPCAWPRGSCRGRPLVSRGLLACREGEDRVARQGRCARRAALGAPSPELAPAERPSAGCPSLTDPNPYCPCRTPTPRRPAGQKTHPLPLKPPIVMTPTVFSGFELIFALNRTETASCWAPKPGGQSQGSRVQSGSRGERRVHERQLGCSRRADRAAGEEGRRNGRVGGKSPLRMYSEESILRSGWCRAASGVRGVSELRCELGDGRASRSRAREVGDAQEHHSLAMRRRRAATDGAGVSRRTSAARQDQPGRRRAPREPWWEQERREGGARGGRGGCWGATADGRAGGCSSRGRAAWRCWDLAPPTGELGRFPEISSAASHFALVVGARRAKRRTRTQ